MNILTRLARYSLILPLALVVTCGVFTPSQSFETMVPSPRNHQSLETAPSQAIRSSSLTVLDMPAPESSPTFELPSSTPSVTRQPATLTPSQIHSNEEVPDQTSDLLFISKGNLMRWDHITGHMSLLVEGVVVFSASENGKQIAILRPRGISANGVELFDLDLLDLETKQIFDLVERVPHLHNLLISPDGGWISYTTDLQGGLVLGIDVNNPDQEVEFGKCNYELQESIPHITWSPDSRSILWTDDRGVWIADGENSTARLIHHNIVRILDPKGKETEFSVNFNSPLWSPSGRFVLINVSPKDSEIYWQAVLDSRLGRLVQVPDTYSNLNSRVVANWFEDGKLWIASRNDPSQPLQIKIWEVLPTRPDLLFLNESYKIYLDQYKEMISQNDLDNLNGIAWLDHSEPKFYDLLFIGKYPGSRQILLHLHLGNRLMEELTEIPVDTELIIWSPDGSGGLVIGKNNQILFAPVQGGVIDLSPVLGSDAHNFLWLPPTPRS